MKVKYVVSLLLVMIVLFSGCLCCTTKNEYEQPDLIVSKNEYEQPDLIVSKSTTTVVQVTTKATTKMTTTKATTTTTKPKIQTFNVGQTASDGDISITVNDVKYVQVIDETDNQFLVETAPSGKKYAIVDLTVENLMSTKSVSLSSIMQVELQDGDGYVYDMDFSGMTALEKSLKSGDIVPGAKRRGQVAFLIPESAINNKFNFKFDLFGTTAVFNLPDKETVYSTKFDELPEAKCSVNIVTVKSSWTQFMDYGGSGSINEITLTVSNTGDSGFEPTFDVEIEHSGETITSETDATSDFYGTLKAGETKTVSLMLFEMIDDAGQYKVTVTLREKGNTKTIDTATKTINVS